MPELTPEGEVTEIEETNARFYSVTAVLATNVFERRGTRWRMVLHRASHILMGEPGAEG